MTMTTDIDKLRELAVVATAGPWQVVENLHEYSLNEGHKNKLTERRIFTTWEHPQAKQEVGIVSAANTIAKYDNGTFKTICAISSEDAAFIAAANPTAIITLLDALEAANKRIAELENEIEGLYENMAGESI